MVRIFANRLKTQDMFNLQRFQYSEKLILSDTVPAGQAKLGKVAVSNLGHFLLTHITGTFTTIRTENYILPGAGAATDNQIDSGVNYLRGQLIDGNGQKKLFSDYIPFDLFLSPGRIKDGDSYNDLIAALNSVGGTVANHAGDSNALFYPQEFEYLFSANSDILFDVKNDSNLANSYNITLHGIRILSSAAVKGV
jgi:hypothetical protein